jgi:hypothetical protein
MKEKNIYIVTKVGLHLRLQSQTHPKHDIMHFYNWKSTCATYKICSLFVFETTLLKFLLIFLHQEYDH